jgi:hypothetical protein
MQDRSVLRSSDAGIEPTALDFAGIRGPVSAWLLHCADPLGSMLPPPRTQLSARQLPKLYLKANAHKVLPSVLRHYPIQDGDAKLEQIREEADTWRIEAAALSTMLKHHAGAIAEAANGLPVALVKGPAFSSLYPLGLRPFGDIDLLAAPSALPKLASILNGHRFSRVDEDPTKLEDAWIQRDNNLLMIEVHTNLVHSRRMRTAFSLTYDDLAGYFDRPAALLTVAVMHGATHFFAWLRHVVDVCQATRAVVTTDEESLFEMLTECTGTRMAAIVGLNLAYRVFGEKRCLEIAQALGAPHDYRFAPTLIEGAVLTAPMDNWLLYNSWRRFVFGEMLLKGTRREARVNGSNLKVSRAPSTAHYALSRKNYEALTTNDLPPVSCMCMTYGRPHLLEEAIESFLRQDYAGAKELIVLNDLPEQELRFEHPQVRIINVRKRFHTIGEKRNSCAALCTNQWLLPWDDDDIYLPWRITYSVEMLGGERYFKAAKAFIFDNGAITKISKNIFHSASAWHRSLFDEVQGYPHMGSGQDVALEAKFKRVLGREKLGFDDIPIDKIYYVYRWLGIGSYHLSALGQTPKEKRKDNESDSDLVTRYVASQLASGSLKSGRIFLTPHWKVDYQAKATDYIDRLRQS